MRRVILCIATLLAVAASAWACTSDRSPSSPPTVASSASHATPGTLSGSITGLDPGHTATVRIERLEGTPTGGTPRGALSGTFDVASGEWQQEGMALPEGHYVLRAASQGYVAMPGGRSFQVPEEGIRWQYPGLDFELVRPEDAEARFGMPLCTEPSEHGGTVSMPPGTPTPTPTFSPPGAPRAPVSPPPYPPGSCYAGHFATTPYGWGMSGMRGQLSGLPEEATGKVTIQRLPPMLSEHYAVGGAPPPDGRWTYPPEVRPLDSLEGLEPLPSVATLEAANAVWGLVDASLTGHAYLVTARAPGYRAEPSAYIVVVFAGKVPGFPDDVDFHFQAAGTPAAPTPHAAQGNAATGYARLVEVLRAAGAAVESSGEVAPDSLSVKGQRLSVNGERVDVFEYANAVQADIEGARISPDGSTATLDLGNGMRRMVHSEWVAPPHFYRAGRLIVFYVGSDRVVLELLEAVLGPQFAGWQR